MTRPKRGSFNTHYGRYAAWFSHHLAAYHSELLAVRALLPCQGLGLEIGVRTGRFAAPLGVKFGVDTLTLPKRCSPMPSKGASLASKG